MIKIIGITLAAFLIAAGFYLNLSATSSLYL
ncbi:hypothetical protein Hbal_2249 [Hirschia baltica ATCC 49814]|uniref:Uncharacterized protein n=1 Tax=Hirschia baltica (strain ATCC 49814 / DSM 5838 / IFAM 1418) TaxID=582402 RepID=C6XML5_HIRBI|nr:hypothetical protein Hbal_2249 [Hirschia baltica ATCC 49814]